MTVPSMHLSGPLHHWNKPNAQELEALASPVHWNSSINIPKETLVHVWLHLTKNDDTTCSNGGCGLPLQKFDRVQVAFLSIESFACSFNWDNSGTRAPWLRTRSRHLGESPATFPKAHTAYNFKVSVFRMVQQKFKKGEYPCYHIPVSINIPAPEHHH